MKITATRSKSRKEVLLVADGKAVPADTDITLKAEGLARLMWAWGDAGVAAGAKAVADSKRTRRRVSRSEQGRITEVIEEPIPPWEDAPAPGVPDPSTW